MDEDQAADQTRDMSQSDWVEFVSGLVGLTFEGIGTIAAAGSQPGEVITTTGDTVIIEQPGFWEEAGISPAVGMTGVALVALAALWLLAR